MTARIYQPARNAMQSGDGGANVWVLDYAPSQPKSVDPLMGWTGSADMNRQVRLRFDSKEAALAYAAKHGIAAMVSEPHARKRTPRGYGDNFATARRVPWSH